MDEYAGLKLENQICFPLYAASRLVIKQYRPLLDELGITYTQYITMRVLWEYKKLNVKELGEKLLLDSGTLTPMLKSLEQKGYVLRSRSKADERVLLVEITEKGQALKQKAKDIPKMVSGCVKLENEEAFLLYKLLYKLIDELK